MPSGAKKRKAAKKKLQKVANSNNGSHSRGVDDPKSHDERSSDGGDVEREENFEGTGVNNGEEGAKDVSLTEENVAEGTEKSNDVARELKNGDHKSSSSSSSSSGSDYDEVAVEKEKIAEAELPKEELQSVVDSVEDSIVPEVVQEAIEEGIPSEESVKQVVSLPQESIALVESVPVENWSTSDVIESELKQNVDEVLHLPDENSKSASVVADLVQEKIEEKVIPVVNEVSESPSEVVDVIAKDDEALLPQSSAVKAVEGCVHDNDKDSETHKPAEEEPLISAPPLPVRRTSMFNCCGLFEVFSGGSSR